MLPFDKAVRPKITAVFLPPHLPLSPQRSYYVIYDFIALVMQCVILQWQSECIMGMCKLSVEFVCSCVRVKHNA